MFAVEVLQVAQSCDVDMILEAIVDSVWRISEIIEQNAEI